MLLENIPTKIAIPQNELELYFRDYDIQNETEEQITLFCIKAKNVTKTIPGCGKNFCGIGIKFFKKNNTKTVEAHYCGNDPVYLDLVGESQAKIRIDSTKFMDNGGKNLTFCSWDDHDGEYLIGKVVNIDHRSVQLYSDNLIHDEPSSDKIAKDNKWITPLHIPSERSMDITIPKNDLVLFVVNKQNSASKRDTFFCFKAKNKVDDDMICGNGFCGIRILNDGEGDHKLQHAIYGNVVKQRPFDSNLPDITTIWINKTTITNSDFNETSSNCEWDDHGGKYLTVELRKHENTKVYLVPLMIFLTETFLLLVLRIIYGILVIQKLRRKIIYVTPTLNFDDSYFDEN
uniref:Uncharacterized protein n=1 Tax=Panagrolaimus sp. JU765 TaxID=591449 RepID=A0AC34RTI0_9BILA